MSHVATILIVGFAIVATEIGSGLQAVKQSLSEGLDQMRSMEKTLETELNWARSSSFAGQINGALLDIGKAVDDMDRSIGRLPN